MKVLLVIWLLSAGIGVSYSVISERKKRVEFLGTMEQDLKKLAYYMCEWRLPVEEADFEDGTDFDDDNDDDFDYDEFDFDEE